MIDFCPKHPNIYLVPSNAMPGTGWCSACQTWRNTLDGGDVIEGYEHQVKHMRERVSFLEHYIAGLRMGPPKPKGRRNPAMQKGQVPRRLQR